MCLFSSVISYDLQATPPKSIGPDSPFMMLIVECKGWDVEFLAEEIVGHESHTPSSGAQN